VKNEEVLQRVKEERNILLAITGKKSKFVGHILHTYCLIKPVLEGKIGGKVQGTARRGRMCTKLLDYHEEKR
jgi:hypothetical protein